MQLVLQNCLFGGKKGGSEKLFFASFLPPVSHCIFGLRNGTTSHGLTLLPLILEIVGGTKASIGQVSIPSINQGCAQAQPHSQGGKTVGGCGSGQGERQLGLSKVEEFHKWCLVYLLQSHSHFFVSKQSPQPHSWPNRNWYKMDITHFDSQPVHA